MAIKGGSIDFMFLGPSRTVRWIRYCRHDTQMIAFITDFFTVLSRFSSTLSSSRDSNRTFTDNTSYYSFCNCNAFIKPLKNSVQIKIDRCRLYKNNFVSLLKKFILQSQGSKPKEKVAKSQVCQTIKSVSVYESS